MPFKKYPGLTLVGLVMGLALSAHAQKEILEVTEPTIPVAADSIEVEQTDSVLSDPISSGATAQKDTTENEVTAVSVDSGFTVEVDHGLARNADKNLALALLGSALLPGTGEIYLRQANQGKPFMLVEAGFWATFLIAWWSSDSYLQSARNQASEFAGLDAANKSEKFLNTMSDYRSYLEKEHRNDSYELAQILSGKRDGKYDIAATPENYWDFGSSNTPENTRHWKTFQSTLRYYRASKIALTFAVGGLAMNRIVALAHTLRLYRHTTTKGLSWQALPEIGPDWAGGRLVYGF
jgi:hypothetical protein